jgi:hypothetical protein
MAQMNGSASQLSPRRQTRGTLGSVRRVICSRGELEQRPSAGSGLTTSRKDAAITIRRLSARATRASCGASVVQGGTSQQTDLQKCWSGWG